MSVRPSRAEMRLRTQPPRSPPSFEGSSWTEAARTRLGTAPRTGDLEVRRDAQRLLDPIIHSCR